MTKAKVLKKRLLEAHTIAARFITGKEYQAIFNFIRVSIRDDKVILCGMDGRLYIERTIDPDGVKVISNEGQTDVLVPPDTFKKVISSDPSNELVLEIANNALTIIGKGKFTLHGNIDVDDYWDLKDSPTTIEVPWETLRRGLERASHFVSDYNDRFATYGARIKISGGKLSITSTDLSAVVEGVADCGVDAELDVIIPAVGIEALSSIAEKIVLTLDEGLLRYETGLIRGDVTTLVGEYPRVEPLLDSIEPQATATLCVQDLLDSSRRIQLLGEPSTPIVYTVGDDKLEIKTKDASKGSASIALECKTVGRFKATVNPLYVINFLRNVLESRKKQVHFSLSKTLSNNVMPITMVVENDSMNYRYLAMPQESSCI